MLTLAPAPYYRPDANRSSAKRYSAALLATALAAALSQPLTPVFGNGTLFATALLAVLATAWYGGLGPSLMAAILGGLAGALSPRLGATNRVAFLAISAASILLAEAYRRHLSHAADRIAVSKNTEERLQLRAADLLRENEALRESKEKAVREKSEVEQRLEAGERRMEVAQAAACLVIFDWDLHQQALSMGGDPQPIFGIPTARLQTYEAWLDCLHPDDRASVDRGVARAIEQRAALDAEFRVVWPDASVHWVAAKGSVVGDRSGSSARLIGIYQDITRRKTTEEALVRNEKLAAAGRLAATIAHEINNPLAALTNLLFILKSDETLSRAGVEYVGLAEGELSRIAHLTKQALGFYKDTAQPVPVNVPDALDEVLALYGRNMAANIRVEKKYGASLEVQAFKGEIQQVFANLVSNALQAMREGGALTVEASAAGSSNNGAGMQVRVRDTGPGISPEHVSRIFEPFFTTKPDVGTGLGLWLAKQIIERHGGTIRVESSIGEQHGTCFSVWLPAAADRMSDIMTAA